LDFPSDLNPLLARSIGYQGKGPISCGLDDKKFIDRSCLKGRREKMFQD
jgi:hypothetical protein